jgi:HicA toxin of bacterial toxin-antitoxin,
MNMSRGEKLIKRLLSKPKDFTYNELKALLSHLGYIESQSGKTSGSRVAFVNEKDKHIIRLHKPHPNNELKQYQIEQIIEELKSRSLI